MRAERTPHAPVRARAGGLASVSPLLCLLCLLTVPLPAAAGPASRCRKPALHVHKLEGQLVLTCAGRVRLAAPASFGGEPLGHKHRSGDQRTPEGTYRVCGKHRSRRFYKFLSVSYPGRADADRALGKGQITKEQHRRIVQAHRAGRCPPFRTPLGGAIGVHGIRPPYRAALAVWTRLSRVARIYRYVGMSDGCIMVDNRVMDRLWPLVPVGTPIHVHGPSVAGGRAGAGAR